MMDKYVETLDSLIKVKKEKKKKDTSPKERKAFQEAWVNLAVSEGFSDKAEQFLYDGFAFCGAEPFYAYLVQTQDLNATLNTMFSGKMYGKDSNVTFRLVTHLLALMLNANVSQNVLAPIIKRLPGACQNKDKKRLGTAEKTMEKYFFAVLSPDVTLCPLADIETKPVFVNEFVAVVSSVMAGIENGNALKGTIAVNIAKVRKWISDYDRTENRSSDTKMSDIPSVSTQIEDTSTKKGNKPPEAIKSAKPIVPAEKPSEDLGVYLADLMEKAARAVSDIRVESIQQKQKTDTIIHALEDEKEKLRHANHRIAELQDTITSLRQKLSKTESDVVVLKQTVEKKDSIIFEKDAEISERIKMAEVLSRDRAKQADEILQRMASKIKVEYRDFQDAIDVPMSCDLGENLRIQLQSIFDMLEKGGMKIR